MSEPAHRDRNVGTFRHKTRDDTLWNQSGCKHPLARDDSPMLRPAPGASGLCQCWRSVLRRSLRGTWRQRARTRRLAEAREVAFMKGFEAPARGISSAPGWPSSALKGIHCCPPCRSKLASGQVRLHGTAGQIQDTHRSLQAALPPPRSGRVACRRISGMMAPRWQRRARP